MLSFPTISTSECQAILEKESLSLEDRFSLQRFQCRTLAGEYSDLSPNEIYEVKNLEEKNLYKIINSTGMLLGMFGEHVQQQVLSSRFIGKLYSMDKDYDVSADDWERARFKMAIGHMLSNFNESPKAWPVFDGKIPSRPFKFRQITAETWYKDIVSLITTIAGTVYAKRGAEEAFAFVCGFIAHHLQHSQPERYSISSYTDENDAVYGILVSYINKMGGDSSHILK